MTRSWRHIPLCHWKLIDWHRHWHWRKMNALLVHSATMKSTRAQAGREVWYVCWWDVRMWVWVCRFPEMSLSSSTHGTTDVIVSCRILFTTDTHLNTRVWAHVWECAFLNSPSTDRTDQTVLLFLPSISGHSQPKLVDSPLVLAFSELIFFFFFCLDQRVAH